MILSTTAKQVAEITKRIDRNVNWNTESFMIGLLEWPQSAMLTGALSVQVVIPDHVDFDIAIKVVGVLGYTLERMPPNEHGPAMAKISWA